MVEKKEDQAEMYEFQQDKIWQQLYANTVLFI